MYSNTSHVFYELAFIFRGWPGFPGTIFCRSIPSSPRKKAPFPKERPVDVLILICWSLSGYFCFRNILYVSLSVLRRTPSPVTNPSAVPLIFAQQLDQGWFSGRVPIPDFTGLVSIYLATAHRYGSVSTIVEKKLFCHKQPFLLYLRDFTHPRQRH